MDIAAVAAGLADNLASIERGELEATPMQEAYIAGAVVAFGGRIAA